RSSGSAHHVAPAHRRARRDSTGPARDAAPAPAAAPLPLTPGHGFAPVIRPYPSRSVSGSSTLHEPYPIHSGRDRRSADATTRSTGRGSLAPSSSATSVVVAPSAATRSAASTFRKPWWVNPVSGSVYRMPR